VCVSTDGQTTWAFGDGDYGKLGLGNSTAKPTPTKIDGLLGVPVTKVACGTQFTVALTRDGLVYTWGQGMFTLGDRVCLHMGTGYVQLYKGELFAFSEISRNLYLKFFLECFMVRNFDLSFFKENVKTKNFSSCFVEEPLFVIKNIALDVCLCVSLCVHACIHACVCVCKHTCDVCLGDTV